MTLDEIKAHLPMDDVRQRVHRYFDAHGMAPYDNANLDWEAQTAHHNFAVHLFNTLHCKRSLLVHLDNLLANVCLEKNDVRDLAAVVFGP